MSGLVFEGRGRPVVVWGEVVEARREERVDVKAPLVAEVREVGLEVRERGRPYREDLDVMVRGCRRRGIEMMRVFGCLVKWSAGGGLQ